MTPNFLSFIAFSLLLVLGGMAVNANAGDVEVTWKAPELNTNGDPVSADDIAGYRIYYASNGSEQFIEVGPVESAVIEGLFGLYRFQMTTIAYGVESQRSEPIELLVIYDIRAPSMMRIVCMPPAVCVDPGDL